MAGKLTVWGTTPAEAMREAIQDAGLPQGFVEYHSGANPPIMNGGTLLVLGNSGVAHLAKLGVFPKNRTVTSLRTDSHVWGGNEVRVSYSPAMKNLDSGYYTDFLTDLVLAVRLATTGSIDPELGTYSYVDDFTDYCTQLQNQFKKSSKVIPIVFDTETIGLDYLHKGDDTRPAARFVSLQLSIRAGESHVVYFGSMQEQTDWLKKHEQQLLFLFTHPQLSMGGANLTYDLKWLRHFTGIISTNFKFDTTLVGSLLDENRSNSLATHAKLYVPSLGGYSDAFDARTDKSRMDLVSKKDLLDYGGGDTDACYQVRERMTQELKKDAKLATFYIKILHPAQKAFGEAEFNGVHVDMDRYAELERDLNKVLNEATRKAAEAVGGRIYAKHKDESKAGGINITKASLIKDFMFSPMGLNLKPRMTTAKSGAPSTSREHIEMFSDIPEAKAFVDAFKEYGSAAKMLSTYVTGFQKHLRSDGKFHPSYFLFMGDKQMGEGGTKCMPRGELVLTNKGYLPIEAVTTAHQVLSHTGEARKVLAQINNGKKPVFKIRLQNGCELKTTGNHPYLTEGGKWVNAEDLALGDKVVVHSAAEEWRVVAEFPNYKVSSWGRVKNSKTNNILTQFEKGQWGHLRVTLTRNGAQDRRTGDKRDVPVHRLVAEYFEVSGVGEEVRHLNGIAWDNTVSNLQYGSSKDNSQDAMLHGTTTKRKGVQAKLTEEVVLKLRGSEAYLSSREAGLKYGVSPSLVRRVRRGERWEPRPTLPNPTAFSTSEVTAIVSVGLQQTYGVEVEIDHSHVTQGIVTHNTGRLSCRNPAFQTIPKHTIWGKRIRSCMTAPEGFLVTEKDYSQGELKVVACMANELNMIKAYREGKDLHVLTAALVNDMSYDQLLSLKATDYDLYDSLRSNGKAGNFGLLYGMSAAGFQAYAATVYGVHMTLQEAEDFRTAYLYKSYPALPTYHEVYKDMARRTGFITSPLGRKRHLPLARSRNQEARSGAERQAINSGVQSTLSDMLCWAMAISHERGHTKHSPCFGAIHDATYNYVPEDNWEKWVKKDLEIMENLPFEQVGWKPQLNFTADAKIGTSMGELEDCVFS